MDGTYIAEYLFARSAAIVVQSRIRIETSRTEIAASRRRRWRTIRGGSASDAEATGTAEAPAGSSGVGVPGGGVAQPSRGAVE